MLSCVNGLASQSGMVMYIIFSPGKGAGGLRLKP
jgi:hypothetical protein